MKWSYSLHNAMRRCQRQFGYAYVVASHASSGRRREVFVLKQLQSFSAWQGSVMHEVLATELYRDLAAGRRMSVVRLGDAVEQLARRQLAFSIGRRYREPGQTKTAAGDEFCALYEHEYEKPLPADAATRVTATARDCFSWLKSQSELVSLLEHGSHFESESTLDCRIDGSPVTSTVDLAFRSASGRLVIVDWKVAASETSEYSRQLLVYALVAIRSAHWPGLRASDIDLYEVNLLRREIRSVSATDHAVDAAEDFIYRSLVEMRTLSSAAHAEDLSALELARSAMSCTFCSFARPCVSDLADESLQFETVAVQGHLL